MSEQKPLWPAQRDTARELPWYRAWLESTGREVVMVDPDPDPDPDPGEGRAYVGYRCRRREHQSCKGRWGSAHCTCPCHQKEEAT